jgi:hypothetical protein
VLKVLERNPDHDHPDDWYYWKREALLYASGILDNLPAGLRAPRCLLVEDRPPASTWIWMEVVAGLHGQRWSHAQYVAMARRLGTFNGAYLTGWPIPSAPWLQAAWLRSHVTWSRPMLDRLAEHGDHPIVRRMWPAWLVPGINRLWNEREILLDALDRLPQTFCHRDATSHNLFLQPGEDGEEEVVAIDWAFAGRGVLGEDLAGLVGGALAFVEVTPAEVATLDRAVFSAYLGELRAAGWDGDERLVRLGYTASMALRGGPGFVGWAFDAVYESTEESAEAICQAFYGRPADEALDYRSRLIAYALQLGDEARQLAQTLS